MSGVRPRYEGLASLTGVDSMREAIVSILLHWFIHGARVDRQRQHSSLAYTVSL